MIKKVSALTAALALSAPAAIAGPYANIENNAGWAGSTFNGSSTDIHIGYEGSGENVGYYIQGGPTILSPNGGNAEVEFGGKAGGSIAANDKLSFYGELSFLTGNAANGYGTKVGAKYKF